MSKSPIRHKIFRWEYIVLGHLCVMSLYYLNETTTVSIMTFKIVAFSIMTFSIMTFCIMTVSILKFSIMKFSIISSSILTLRLMTFSITPHNGITCDTRHYSKWHSVVHYAECGMFYCYGEYGNGYATLLIVIEPSVV